MIKMYDNKRKILIWISIIFTIMLIVIVFIDIYELHVLNSQIDDLRYVCIMMGTKILVGIIAFHASILLVRHMFNKEVNFEHLTGLCSRKKLYTDLNNLINKNAPFTICYIDFNDFKVINDKFGHAAGDLLLKEFARRINHIKPKEITGYRIGGDEFVIVINNNIDINNSIESIWKIADDKVKITQREYIKFSFAMGISKNDFFSNADVLVKRADYNMYENKRT
jgi:diguanylate cyclase (GGDEF)-like protein